MLRQTLLTKYLINIYLSSNLCGHVCKHQLLSSYQITPPIIISDHVHYHHQIIWPYPTPVKNIWSTHTCQTIWSDTTPVKTTDLTQTQSKPVILHQYCWNIWFFNNSVCCIIRCDSCGVWTDDLTPPLLNYLIMHYLLKHLIVHHPYWVVQAGLLTPLTFARYRLSPLAAFTTGVYFLHNGRWWQSICKFSTANFKDISGGP